jgi:putative nucleotidyltransferase with HDIG domain
MKKKSARKVAQVFLNKVLASAAEKEVERLFKVILPGTPFANKTHAVGGYVRDQYISLLKGDPKIQPKDLDIVVEMEDGAEKITHYIKNRFKDAISTPVQMGNYPIWQITFKEDIEHNKKKYNTKGAVIEFADTMEEEFPEEGSRQRKVKYAPLKKDIERRDFTVNMLLKDLTTGEIKDLTGMSKKDIEKGVLRHVDNVMLDKRFKEDPLRLMRLIRFAAVKEWDIPKEVLRIAKNNADRIKIISKERIRAELEKTMETGKLKQAIRLMGTIGIRQYILPEIEALKGITQGDKYHQEGDVYKHTLKVLENAKPGIENQMAALLHDIGKPETQRILPDKTTFYEHQHAGAEIAKAIMKRLKFDNSTSEKVVNLVKRHMDPLLKLKSGEKSLRKYIREVGDETVDAILDLARADELGRLPSKNDIPDLIEKIKEIREAPVKIDKKPVLDGKEIMELLKLNSGPEVGKAKEYLLDIQDDYASKKENLTKDEAKKLLLKEYRK